MAMGVVMNDALAFQRLDQCLETKITLRHLVRIIDSLLDLGLIFLCLDVGLANKRGRLGPGSRKRGGALRVGSIGHLQAAHRPAIGILDEEVVNLAPSSEFQIGGSAADQVA